MREKLKRVVPNWRFLEYGEEEEKEKGETLLELMQR
jgi:hypothetical protein